MKILITGASGRIGRLLIDHFIGHELVLWGRTRPVSDKGFETKSCNDLSNTKWWTEVQIPAGCDAIIHLAEPVKIDADETKIATIVNSHCSFIEKACKEKIVVIYPDTAYRYDRHLGKAARSYLKIKRSVVERMQSCEGFVSPVIHPLIDSDASLAKFLVLQRKVPFFNLFSAFDASLPILTTMKLKELFEAQIASKTTVAADWYESKKTIANLTNMSSRIDARGLSLLFKFFLKPLSGNPTIQLLLKGRVI